MGFLDYLEVIQKKFTWSNKRSKIKHSTLISEYCDGGLKDVDIRSIIEYLIVSAIV